MLAFAALLLTFPLAWLLVPFGAMLARRLASAARRRDALVDIAWMAAAAVAV